MLIPELDKLRDKTLSFWCVLWRYETEYDKELTMGTYISDNVPDEYTIQYRVKLFNWKVIKMDSEYEYKIIWHPLTLWRIEHIYWSIDKENRYDKLFVELKHLILKWIVDNNIIDKSELERMQHEKWPELKELLLQFSNYLK